MNETIFCQKLQEHAAPLKRAPYPGEIGKRILQNISQPAWQMWLKQQTILINEYRINPLDPKSRHFLETQMLAFLFGEGETEQPEQFKPQ